MIAKSFMTCVGVDSSWLASVNLYDLKLWLITLRKISKPTHFVCELFLVFPSFWPSFIEIGEMACITPAWSSHELSLKYYQPSHWEIYRPMYRPIYRPMYQPILDAINRYIDRYIDQYTQWWSISECKIYRPIGVSVDTQLIYINRYSTEHRPLHSRYSTDTWSSVRRDIYRPIYIDRYIGHGHP